jgi:hypothetical protein
MVTPDDPIHVVVTRGARAPRLEALARIPAGADVSALQKVAADKGEDAVVRSAVIVQLAKRGHAAKAEADAPPAVKSALTRATRVLHAQRLVAGYEAGRAPEPLPRATAAPAPAAAPAIELFRPPDAELKRVVAAAAAPMREAPHVVGLRCAGAELALVAPAKRLDAAALLRTPARVGQVAVHHMAERDAWTAPFDVLTEPAGGALHISVLDERGRPRFSGSAQKAKGGLQFSIAAVPAPGVAPVTIEGTLIGGALEITSARSAERAPAGRAPKPS